MSEQFNSFTVLLADTLEKSSHSHPPSPKDNQAVQVEAAKFEAAKEVHQSVDVDVYLAEINQLKTDLVEKESIINGLQENLESKSAALAALQVKLNESEEAQREISNTLKAWKDQNDVLEQVIRDKNTDIEHLRTQMETTENVRKEEYAKFSNMEKEMIVLLEKTNLLEIKLNQQMDINLSLEKLLKDETTKKRIMETQLHANEEYKTKYLHCEETLHGLQDEYKTLETQYSEAKETIKKLQLHVEEIIRQKNELEIRCKEVDREMTMRTDGMKQEILELSDKVSANELENASLREKLEVTQRELQNTREVVSSGETVAASLRESLSAVELELNTERQNGNHRSNALEEQLRVSIADGECVREMNAKLARAVQLTEERMQATQQELEYVKEQHRLTIESMAQSLEAAEKRALRAEAEADRVSNLGVETDIMRQKLADVEGRLSTELSQKASLQQEVDMLKSKYLELQYENEVAQQSRMKLQGELKELTERHVSEVATLQESSKLERHAIETKLQQEIDLVNELAEKVHDKELQLQHQIKISNELEEKAKWLKDQCDMKEKELRETLEKSSLHESTLQRLEEKKKKDLEYLKRQNEQIADLQRRLDQRDEAHEDTVNELKRSLELGEVKARLAEERESHLVAKCSALEEHIVQLESSLELTRKELKALQQQLPPSPSGESHSQSPSSESDDSYVVVATGSKSLPGEPVSNSDKKNHPEAAKENTSSIIEKLTLEVS